MIEALRDLKLELFLAGRMWAEKLEEEENLGTPETAGRGARECVREDVAVALRCDNPECELALGRLFA